MRRASPASRSHATAPRLPHVHVHVHVVHVHVVNAHVVNVYALHAHVMNVHAVLVVVHARCIQHAQDVTRLSVSRDGTGSFL